MHSADRSTAGGGLHVFIENLVRKLCLFDRRTSTVELSRRADEDANLVWHDAFLGSFRKPLADCLDLMLATIQNHDVRLWTIERRDRAPSFFLITIYVRYLRTQQPVRLRSDLMRRSVIDSQRRRT